MSTDHVFEAERLARMAVRAPAAPGALVLATAAQVHATLALAASGALPHGGRAEASAGESTCVRCGEPIRWLGVHQGVPVWMHRPGAEHGHVAEPVMPDE
ncbi:hypothetical protein [Streptomyces mobaraensis]|uniref:Uncharacterized protein n=1 Tax=Streptomyces mobaraensis TaxID=35621 RepID=A0A5N5WDE6_STRMB|nr:hypothetical protein [Streptomyces mobaraensis]KAB7850194.1 hypothetical protein FRZ00_06240 [Streptomyces mobaraensis]